MRFLKDPRLRVAQLRCMHYSLVLRGLRPRPAGASPEWGSEGAARSAPHGTSGAEQRYRESSERFLESDRRASGDAL